MHWPYILWKYFNNEFTFNECWRKINKFPSYCSWFSFEPILPITYPVKCVFFILMCQYIYTHSYTRVCAHYWYTYSNKIIILFIPQCQYWCLGVWHIYAYLLFEWIDFLITLGKIDVTWLVNYNFWIYRKKNIVYSIYNFIRSENGIN